MPPDSPWLTKAEDAHRARRSVNRTNLALDRADLHGHQRCRGGRWTVHIDAVDAWTRGLDEQAQMAACGCVRLRPVKRQAA
jgi:hypothetical protein